MTLLSLVFTVTALAASQEAALTESEAVTLTLSRPAFEVWRDAQRRLADGKADAAGRWANPEIEVSREQADVPGGEAVDQFLWIRQRLDVTGELRLMRKAGESQRDALLARQIHDERERTRATRRVFYDALAADQRQRALEAWKEGTAGLRDAVTARVAQGDSARFDLLRLRREDGLVEARLARAAAATHQHRTTLFSMLESQPRPLVGKLLPSDAEAPHFDPAAHPLIAALGKESEGAQLQAKAADRQRWPQLTVGVGQLRGEAPEFRGDGPLLGLEVELPLFQRGNAEREIATAQSDLAASERTVVLARLQAEYDAGTHALATQRAAAMALAATNDESLLTIAQAAYQAGEIGVAELLDAYQSQAEAAQLAIDMALAARRNWIDLQYLIGE